MRRILIILLFLTGCVTPLHHADAIVVLGGGIRDDSTMQPLTQARIEHGISLFLDDDAPLVLVSGRWSYLSGKEHLVTEADAMYDYAIHNGVASDHVLQDKRAQDTLASALNAYRLLAPRNVTSVIIVTSDFHAFRTHYIFSKFFDDVQVASVTNEEGIADALPQYLKEGIGIAGTITLFPPGTGRERIESFQTCCSPGEN